MARTVLVTETDAEADAYLAKPDCAVRYYFYYLSKLMKKGRLLADHEGPRQFDDEQLTVDWAIDNIMMAGSPATVADKLLAVREQVGPFGTLVLTGLDWDDPALWKRSMALTWPRRSCRVCVGRPRPPSPPNSLHSYDNRPETPQGGRAGLETRTGRCDHRGCAGLGKRRRRSGLRAGHGDQGDHQPLL